VKVEKLMGTGQPSSAWKTAAGTEMKVVVTSDSLV